MAVYVELSESELGQVCAAFGLGQLREFEGIPQGTINTNYRLETDRGRFFLRHTTARPSADLDFEASLLDHLSGASLPMPRLVHSKQGPAHLPMHGGLVSVFEWLRGRELRQGEASSAQGERLGEALAKVHLQGLSFGLRRKNPYGPETVRAWLHALHGENDAEVRRVLPLLTSSFERSVEQARAAAPLVEGPIHADLFVDNVKWEGDRVSALFDFEMACTGPLMLDLAITLQSWCFDGNDDPSLARSIVRGYHRVRPIEPAEREGLWGQAVFGAVRFTTSRLRDIHLSKLPPERLSRKDFRMCEAWLTRLLAMGSDGLVRLAALDGA